MLDNNNWLYHGTENAWLHYTYSEEVLEYDITFDESEDELEDPIFDDLEVEEDGWLTEAYAEFDDWLDQVNEDVCINDTYSELVLEDPTTPDEVDNDQSSTELLNEPEMDAMDEVLSFGHTPINHRVYTNIGLSFSLSLIFPQSYNFRTSDRYHVNSLDGQESEVDAPIPKNNQKILHGRLRANA